MDDLKIKNEINQNQTQIHNEKVTLNIIYEETDFNDLTNISIQGSKLSLGLGIGFLLILLVYFAYFTIKNGEFEFEKFRAVLLVGSPIFLFVVFSFIFNFYKSKSMFNSLEDYQKRVRFSFSNEGIEFSDERNFYQQKWDTFNYVQETKNIFFIRSLSSFNLIPKRCFNDKSEILLLREYLKNSFGKNAKLMSH